jgi:hypothetical protein
VKVLSSSTELLSPFPFAFILAKVGGLLSTMLIFTSIMPLMKEIPTFAFNEKLFSSMILTSWTSGKIEVIFVGSITNS